MSGPLTQIAAQGQQSLAVIGNDFSPFNTIVRRVTAFATEPKRIEFNSGTPDYEKTISAEIDRSADLLSKVWLVVEFTPVKTTHTVVQTVTDGDTTSEVKSAPQRCYKCVDDVGTRLIQELTVEAGAITHQTLYPQYLHFKQDITTPYERDHADLTGKIINGQSTGNEAGMINMAYRHNRFYIRLPFWWSESYGKSLPIVAQHLTDVKIKLKIAAKHDLIVKTQTYEDHNQHPTVPPLQTDDFTINDMYLLGEYVYLNDRERQDYATRKHAYLITQVQMHIESVTSNVSSTKARMQPNHPIKVMYWYGIQNPMMAKKDWTNWRGQEDGTGYVLPGELFSTAKLLFNNQERVSPLGPKYFRLIEFIERHTRVPDMWIYMYSFGLAPESSQPSGVVNASRIESFTLELTYSKPLINPYELFVWYENYNVVSVSSGITQLAWAS